MVSPASELLRLRRACEGLTGPLAYLDLAAFDANADALARRAGGKPIRVASKSVRCVQALRRVLARPGYAGVLCYSAREAAFLAKEGLDDLLVAYPCVSPDDLRALARLAREGHTVTVMVDSPAHIELAQAAAEAEGATLPVCLDLDVSQDYPGLHFGMYRSPLKDANGALRLAAQIERSAHLRLEGLMAYEGQVAGLADADASPRTLAIRALKRRALPAIAERRGQVVEALRQVGHSLRFVNGGGTGSLESTAAEDAVTELAAGSGLYSPLLFDGYLGFRHQPAAGFALTVTRRPSRDIVTCQGGGYVASGPAGESRLPRPYLPAGLSLLADEGAGEVQTPLRVPSGVNLDMGDLVFFRHAKAGELCEHFHGLHVIEGEARTALWPTYRGQGQTLN